MRLEWSDDALADLDRFAQFLRDRHPSLAAIVAREIIDKAAILAERPQLGRAISGRPEYRQVVLQVANAAYVFQYRVDGERVVVLRVFHGRETRD
ncbi:MAG TPA: type II toxin-antitoxin system RelE/ParE family toxin [Xanthobacteraceae bacterium]|nr:type II toxin-antitoxin system RelE/ParE family toxin [Xanthobacteraceae bacterium]